MSRTMSADVYSERIGTNAFRVERLGSDALRCCRSGSGRHPERQRVFLRKEHQFNSSDVSAAEALAMSIRRS